MSGFHYEHTETTLAEASPTPWRANGTAVVDVSGRPVATAVDWRQAEAIVAAMNEHEAAQEVAEGLREEIADLRDEIDLYDTEAFRARTRASDAERALAAATEEIRTLKARLARLEPGAVG